MSERPEEGPFEDGTALWDIQPPKGPPKLPKQHPTFGHMNWVEERDYIYEKKVYIFYIYCLFRSA